MAGADPAVADSALLSVEYLPFFLEDRRKATRNREFKLPWREAGPPNHHGDRVNSDR